MVNGLHLYSAFSEVRPLQSISLRCLEQAVCCIMYCNSGPNFPLSPADVTSDDAECANVSDRETVVGHITMKPR